MARTGAGVSLPQPEDQAERPSPAWQELERSFAYINGGAGHQPARVTWPCARDRRRGRSDRRSRPTAPSWWHASATSSWWPRGSRSLTRVHGPSVRYRRRAEALCRAALTFVSGTGPYQVGELRRDQLLAAGLIDVVAAELRLGGDGSRRSGEGGAAADRLSRRRSDYTCGGAPQFDEDVEAAALVGAAPVAGVRAEAAHTQHRAPR